MKNHVNGLHDRFYCKSEFHETNFFILFLSVNDRQTIMMPGCNLSDFIKYIIYFEITSDNPQFLCTKERLRYLESLYSENVEMSIPAFIFVYIWEDYFQFWNLNFFLITIFHLIYSCSIAMLRHE